MIDTFSTDLPDLQSLINQLDMFNEDVNRTVRESVHKGADIIMNEQKRLISGKSQKLADAISKSRVYTTKKSGIGISTGYMPDAFETDSDGFNPGIVGMVFEFGRPGQSTAQRKNEKMKQIRKRIPNKETARRKDWEEAVPTEVEIRKGKIQPQSHIRRGFDNKVEEAVKVVFDSVSSCIDKLEKG